MKKILLLTFLMAVSFILTAQVAPNKYYIQFTDKNDSPYSIDNPVEFLTQRAVDRRSKYDIPVTVKDLPVNPQYLAGVADVGVEILNPTKWLNGVTVFTDDPALIDDVLALPYVANVRDITNKSGKLLEDKPFFKDESVVESSYTFPFKATSLFDYGNSSNQIEMINGIPLHEAGYRGQGVAIAVLDAGFYGTDTHEAFDSLRTNNQILGTKDFVDLSNTVYDYSTHGTSVLSTMGGNYPGQLIGTAPKADFWLLRTEESVGGGPENIVEEYNWVSGAEFADSVGADLINSSLGYTTFDDPSQNHTYEDLDGNTTPAAIGADVAASRGIIVVNSAGNSGNSSWYYVGTPADGDSVFSIGAVDPNGNIAGFSSHGPTADGRIKPNVVAQGAPAYLASAFGGFGNGNGTSFSSPIICGMTACFLQAVPNLTNIEIMTALQESADNADDPDNDYGWGIPDYQAALGAVTQIAENGNESNKLSVFPVPVEEYIYFKINDTNISDFTAQLIDQTGRVFFQRNYTNHFFKTYRIDEAVNKLTPGIYFIRVISDQAILQKKFLKK